MHKQISTCLVALAIMVWGNSSFAADLGFRAETPQEADECIARLEAAAYFPHHTLLNFDSLGRTIIPRQQEIFLTSTRMLLEALQKVEASDAQFMKSYTTVRTALFRIEILAKLFRKAGGDEHEERFERLRVLAKGLEDRLGKFNELDELVKLIKRRKAAGIDPVTPKVKGFSLKEEWELKRASALKELKGWMQAEGWTSAGDRGAVAEIYAIYDKTLWLKDSETVLAVRLKTAKMLRKLQEEIADGDYSPAAEHAGYSLPEVEEKVHELRREIRELGMVMQFTGGLFTFSRVGRVIPETAENVLAKFRFVLDLPVAKTPFSWLPKATVPQPIFAPRELFVLFTEYTLEIGAAKDWAQNQERLRESGLVAASPDLNEVTENIKDLEREPTSLNALMHGLLAQIVQDKPFEVMAELVEKN